MNETRDLVDFALSMKYEGLPAEVRETAKLCVLDTVGVALYGSQMPWSKIVAEYAKEAQSVGESGVWGQGWKTTAALAALANATSAHGIEMDDRSALFDIHCGAAVIPVAIAVGEKTQASGKDMIAAIAAGYEVTYRLCEALLGCCRQRFYGSPIKSLFGATATAGKLLGLKSGELLNAMGIAGSMASGLREWSSDPKGTMIKRFNGGGWPAHNGVMAAILGQKGLTGPATVLEGDRGVCRAFGIEKEPKIGKLTEGLGKRYMIMMREVKPYGTCGGLQCGVEAVNEIKSAIPVKPEQIERIDIGCSTKVRDMHDSKHPQSIMAAQYSLPFVSAYAFFEDLSDPAVWEENILNKPEIVALVQKVKISIDEELDKIYRETNDYGGIKMTVRLKDGKEQKTRVRYFRGQMERPATFEDIHRKFNVLAGHVCSRERLQEIAGLVDKLEEMKNPAPLGEALTRF